MKALEIKNLSVSFGRHEVLKNINFNIEEKTIAIIIGPNGAGKSTLLKAIIGVLPYQGEIKIFGKDHYLMLNYLSYLPQYYNFDPILPLTVKEFLSLSNSDEKKIEEVLKEIDIVNLKNELVSNLSGGQLERVLFARAIINQPKILLLDEPISETDIRGQKEFYSIVEHLNKDHQTTIIIVTHEISIINTFAQKVICLNHTLICDGSVKELFKEENFKKLYKKDIFIYPINKSNF